jgi:hypothetical protein
MGQLKFYPTQLMLQNYKSFNFAGRFTALRFTATARRMQILLMNQHD